MADITKKVFYSSVLCNSQKILVVIDVALTSGYGAPQMLEQWKANSRKKLGLPLTTSADIKCTPKEAQQFLLLSQVKYPSVILPDLNSICGREVWLGENPISPTTKRALAQSISLTHDKPVLPPSVNESIETIIKTLHIPTHAVEMAQVIRENWFYQRNGMYYEFPQPQSENCEPVSQPFDELYTALLPIFSNLIGVMMRLLYHSNIFTDTEKGHSIEQMNCQELINKSISNIVFLLIKLTKYTHVMSFEYLCTLLMENNGLVLFMKILANSFPNTTPSQILSKNSAVADDKEDTRYVNLKYLKVRPNEFSKNNFVNTCLLLRVVHDEDFAADLINDMEEKEEEADLNVKMVREGSVLQQDDLSEMDEYEIDSNTVILKRSTSLDSISSSGSVTDTISNVSTLSSSETLALPSADSLDIEVSKPPIPACRRTLQSTINLLRIIYNLSKNRQANIFSLVQWKTVALFKRMLRMPYQKHLHHNICKIIKLQMPYLGRKWRYSNMKTISEIFMECKMGLMDEWLYHINVEGLFSNSSKKNTKDKDAMLENIVYDVKISDAKEHDGRMKELIRFWHKKRGFDIDTLKINEKVEVEDEDDQWLEFYEEILEKEGFWDGEFEEKE